MVITMKNSFINIIREPDSVLFQYDDSTIRFEEADSKEEQVSKVTFAVVENALRVTVWPCDGASA